MSNTEYVVLVDENDNAIGLEEKMAAHEKGLLHRAFSILLFNEKGEMLLHQRAAQKYHSPNLWTNTCCSHPRENESVADAANRRLMEEMGMTANMIEVLSFKYKASFSNGLIEHELDHVLVGKSVGDTPFNTDEVQAIKYSHPSDILKEMEQDVEKFTPWFVILMQNHWEEIKKHL